MVYNSKLRLYKILVRLLKKIAVNNFPIYSLAVTGTEELSDVWSLHQLYEAARGLTKVMMITTQIANKTNAEQQTVIISWLLFACDCKTLVVVAA